MAKLKSKIKIDDDSTSICYAVASDSYANLKNAIDIWIKFTGYLRPEELLFLEEVKDKNFDSISLNEMNEYYRIKNQLKISELLLKYKNQECTKEEHDQVSKFMNHTSLTSFVKSRLTNDEIGLAFRYISELEKNEQLKNYIETQQKIYENLNIYEAFILFKAKERLFNLEQKNLYKQIRSKQSERNAGLIKILDKKIF